MKTTVTQTRASGENRVSAKLGVLQLSCDLGVGAVFRDVQRERHGASGGERVRDMKGPAGRLPGGAGVHGVAGMLILLR
jgi:hypothetical protein